MDTESPIAYIPVDRRHAEMRGEQLPQRCHGAALFVDISGFTPLTAALSHELGRKQGAEELTKQLNRVYDSLIAEVDRFHGTVIGFAGDAITCWLDGDDGLRAVACSLAIQEVMQQLALVTTPGGTTVALSVKVAIAAGPARRFLVGNPEIQYIDVLAGATLDRMAVAEHNADKDEIVASAEIATMLGAALAIREWRTAEDGSRYAVVDGLTQPVDDDPWPELAPGALSDEQIRPWLLPRLAERLSTGHGEFMAELRPAVSLFVRFGGIDYDRDEHAGAQLDTYIRWVQNIIERYEGALIQLTIGDKGSYFYATFGAPLAHDDDPARAVAAALELRQLPPELLFITRVEIGLSRGRMRTGPYGSISRRTYGVLGEEANMAARYMANAGHGNIMIGESLSEAVANEYTLHFVGPIEVKGKQEPVPVYLVLEHRSRSPMSALYDTVLVGRDRELAHVDMLLDRALAGQGQILQIEGPAGMGKSRLAAALAICATAKGMQVVLGTCHSTTTTTAYRPWHQIMRSLIGLSDTDAVERTIATIEDFVDRTNPEWRLRMPLLGDLLNIVIPDNATTAAFEPLLRQRALFDLVVEMVLFRSSIQPLLLLIDDAHWLDEASTGLTRAIARALSQMPVALVITHRPPLNDAAIMPELATLPQYQYLGLDELAPTGVAEMVTNRLGGPLTALALSLIQAAAQGNPFFVEEVVASLREAGHLYCRSDGKWALAETTFAALRQANCLAREDGHWVLAPSAPLAAADLGLPDSIEGVVLSRIDHLPEGPKLTLRVASVIGHRFALDLLSQVHPLALAEHHILEQVGVLEERDFARQDAPPPEASYRFKHNMTQDVTYDTLLFTQRRQLHQAIGEALERLLPDAIAQLAHHTLNGEDWRRAVQYQLLAGQQAQRLFANHEAIEHFRRVLLSAEHLPPGEALRERQKAYIGLGELCTVTGQHEVALVHLQQALDLALTLADPDAQALACTLFSRVYLKRGELPAVGEWIERGLAASGGRETIETAELYARAAQLFTQKGDTDAALAQCAESLRIGEKIGDVKVQALAQTIRGHVANQRGNYLDAIHSFQDAFALYEQAGNVYGQAIAHNFIANAYYNLGQLRQAEQHYQQALGIFSQTGDIYQSAIVGNNLGGIARRRGQFDAALNLYEEALHSFERIGDSLWVLGVLHMNLGETHILQGQNDTAFEQLRISRRYFDQAQARYFLPELYRHFAEAALISGDLPQARTDAQQALELARELSMRGETGCSLRLLSEIAIAENDLSQAQHQLAESIAMLQEVGDEYELARSYLVQARLLFVLGQVDQGMEALGRAEETFVRLDASIDLVQAVRRELTANTTSA